MSARRHGQPPGARHRSARSGNGRSAEAERLLRLLQALGGSVFRRFLWQRANELDLTFAQSQVLAYVERRPGCHMGDVAKEFRVTMPAASHIVARLEQKGLLARGGDPADRRVCVLDLTRDGEALVRELETLQLDALERVVARLSAPDRRRVLVGLETLVDAGAASADLG